MPGSFFYNFIDKDYAYFKSVKEKFQSKEERRA